MKKTISKENTKPFPIFSHGEAVDFSKPSSMVDQIYRDLGRAIARGELPPGMVLKEIELQKWFGVSRAPIREAIRLLEAGGLVVVDAYKKKSVRHITHEYLREVIPVVALLEGYAAILAAKRLTVEQIDTLKKTNEKMQIAYDQGRYDLCGELNSVFHKVYINAANNQAIKTALKSINKGVVFLWVAQFVYGTHDFIPLSINEHDMIIQEFVKRGSSRAEEVVRNHIIQGLERPIRMEAFDSNGFLVLREKVEEK